MKEIDKTNKSSKPKVYSYTWLYELWAQGGQAEIWNKWTHECVDLYATGNQRSSVNSYRCNVWCRHSSWSCSVCSHSKTAVRAGGSYRSSWRFSLFLGMSDSMVMINKEAKMSLFSVVQDLPWTAKIFKITRGDSRNWRCSMWHIKLLESHIHRGHVHGKSMFWGCWTAHSPQYCQEIQWLQAENYDNGCRLRSSNLSGISSASPSNFNFIRMWQPVTLAVKILTGSSRTFCHCPGSS